MGKKQSETEFACVLKVIDPMNKGKQLRTKTMKRKNS